MAAYSPGAKYMRQETVNRRVKSARYSKQPPVGFQYVLSLLLKLNPAPIYSPTNTLRSTIDDGVLNCRVRHGTGWIHSSISTGNSIS